MTRLSFLWGYHATLELSGIPTRMLWKRRKLTLHGRIKIVKTLGFSKLIYKTSVPEITDSCVKEINNLTFKFIWERKSPKIERKPDHIISDISQGGLRMMDFENTNKALETAWIKRITEHVRHCQIWRFIFSYRVSVRYQTSQPR